MHSFWWRDSNSTDQIPQQSTAEAAEALLDKWLWLVVTLIPDFIHSIIANSTLVTTRTSVTKRA